MSQPIANGLTRKSRRTINAIFFSRGVSCQESVSYTHLDVYKRQDIFCCDCACGNELRVWRSLLANDVQIDCGICVLRPARNGQLRKPYNGYGHWGHTRYYWTRSGKRKMRGSGEFFSWQSMIGRCYCKGHAAYEFYGGRGIRVCERWQPDGKGCLLYTSRCV